MIIMQVIVQYIIQYIRICSLERIARMPRIRMLEDRVINFWVNSKVVPGSRCDVTLDSASTPGLLFRVQTHARTHKYDGPLSPGRALFLSDRDTHSHRCRWWEFHIELPR